MKRWKLLAGTLALGVGLTGVAAAQSQSWGDHARDGRRGQSWSWQDDDHRQDQDRNRDRDRDHDRNGDRRDDRYRRDGQYGGYGNNGYYGRGDGDRDDGYRNGPYGNGGYRGQNGYYGGYGRGGYGNQAARMGYQEGLNYGQSDRSRGRGFNATGSEAYEKADAGYNSSFGDRNAYRQAFRDAYVQGYQAGYGRRY